MDQFPLREIQKQVKRLLHPSTKPVTKKSVGKCMALILQSPFSQQSVVTRRELLTPIFSRGWEREDWNICLTFRLFRGLSKGLVSLLPESECWTGIGAKLGASENKGSEWSKLAQTNWPLPPAQCKRNRRKPPTPSFSLGTDLDCDSNRIWYPLDTQGPWI